MPSIYGMDLLILLILLLLVGLFAGFLGGLFGIGGGVVIVPALYFTFGVLGVPEAARIKLAVGTSLATIIITSIRSVSSHHKHGAVDWALLKSWGPMISMGAIAGAVIARFATAHSLMVLFAVGITAVAIQKLMPKQEAFMTEGFPPVPGGFGRFGLAPGIGILSSLMGIGGGVLGVVTLTHFKRNIHQAIATAAGFGFAIAVPGAIGFMIVGWEQLGLPPLSIGFVSIPAFIIIAMMTSVTAPYGARAAHRLPRDTLNRLFAVYLLVTAILLVRDVL